MLPADPLPRFPYTSVMKSASAEASARRRREQTASLTPQERVAVAERLAEEGLASFMRIHQIDRRTAIARIKATRRLGRRRSACAEADEH